ncbi:hypothetical protein PPL_04855 [Heterostelium album PN500]|uniref:Uncharacterized protein n=1 Tax=Heterostelium pallidum (strain ATCC 26659 / Pp 5 / PN500) TaxID=670386 RepID=D3B8R2_HETP5|nr:hypothetical protein PPL_04855 [Heterostelium album PN500]EFA82430.1 hypothetical protein PPL_04855 [Heterostelium album PN500]|eukprot:XP_020434547.1 hypothetical protein PPL_04855 [Heterostelium album PN500]
MNTAKIQFFPSHSCLASAKLPIGPQTWIDVESIKSATFFSSLGSYNNDYNFKYSIESDQCEPFLRDFNHHIYWCASTSISF